MVTRREAMLGSVLASVLPSVAMPPPLKPCALILAPSNLGLRPNMDGSEPGTWKAPDVLADAGLAHRLSPVVTTRLPKPVYQRGAQEGTRSRNGQTIRRFSTELGAAVSEALKNNQFPVVIGGDCSILLGCLLGARSTGQPSLIHVDGHSDFYHPGNYDSSSRLGTAAGMDLALATGRGEALLASWDGRPLVADEHVIQIGERDELDLDYDYRDIEATHIRRYPVRQVLSEGVGATVKRVLADHKDDLRPYWLHVDLDVLDQKVMPAVDSPGSPGLDFAQLAELISTLIGSGHILGLDVSIYDPELDPKRQYVRAIVDCIAHGLASMRITETKAI